MILSQSSLSTSCHYVFLGLCHTCPLVLEAMPVNHSMANVQADVVTMLQHILRLHSWKCRDAQKRTRFKPGNCRGQNSMKSEVEQGILIEMMYKFAHVLSM